MTILLLSERCLGLQLAAWLPVSGGQSRLESSDRVPWRRARASNFQTVQWPLAVVVDWLRVDAQTMDGPGSGHHAYVPSLKSQQSQRDQRNFAQNHPIHNPSPRHSGFARAEAQPIAKTVHWSSNPPPKQQNLRRNLNDTPSRDQILPIKISPTTRVFHQKTRRFDFACNPA